MPAAAPIGDNSLIATEIEGESETSETSSSDLPWRSKSWRQTPSEIADDSLFSEKPPEGET